MPKRKPTPVPIESLPKPRYGGREGEHCFDGHLHRNDAGGRPLFVSDATHDRAVAVFDGVVERATGLGFELTRDTEGWQRGTFLVKGGHKIQIHVREATRQHAVTGTWRKSVFVPRGLLVFHAKTHYPELQWKDGGRKLEDRLEEIAGALEAKYQAWVEWDGRREVKKAAEVAARREAEEARKREQAEQARFDELIFQVDGWFLAKRIREFVDATERGFIEVHGGFEPDSEAAEWIRWAREQAVMVDPLRRRR